MRSRLSRNGTGMPTGLELKIFFKPGQWNGVGMGNVEL